MVQVCSFSSPLSQKQKTVWSLILKGLSVSAIAKKLNTTRQYVNQTRLTTESKLSSTLLEVARVNDLQISRVYPREGLLVGFHPGLNRKAILTYSTNQGIRIWYWYDHPEEVTNQEFLRKTREYLLDLAEERGIEVEPTSQVHPGRLAQTIFEQLVSELKI